MAFQPLERFGALWFVRSALLDADPERKAGDEPLPPVNRLHLSSVLVSQVQLAHLCAGTAPVVLDPASMNSDNANWQRMYQVRDSVLKSGVKPVIGGADDPDASYAFSDYVTLRWVHYYVWGASAEFSVRPKPDYNRQLPTSFELSDLLQLADDLGDQIQRIGLKPDRKAIRKACSDWAYVLDVRDSVIKNTSD